MTARLTADNGRGRGPVTAVFDLNSLDTIMSDDKITLTTRQGHPLRDNQSLRSVGERGPATLENHQFIEKITHFDREQVVHARGGAARGWFGLCHHRR